MAAGLLLGLLSSPARAALSPENASRLASLQSAEDVGTIARLTFELLRQIEGFPNAVRNPPPEQEQAEILQALLRSRSPYVRSQAADAYMDALPPVQRLVYPAAPVPANAASPLSPTEAVVAGIVTPHPVANATDAAPAPATTRISSLPPLSVEPPSAADVPPPLSRRRLDGDNVLSSVYVRASGGPLAGASEPTFRNGAPSPLHPQAVTPRSCAERVADGAPFP